MESDDKVKVKEDLDGWRSEHEGEEGFILCEGEEADWVVSLTLKNHNTIYTNATFDEEQLEKI